MTLHEPVLLRRSWFHLSEHLQKSKMTTNRPPLAPQQTSTSKTLGPPLHVTPTTLISASALFSGTNPISLGANVIIQLRSRLSSTCKSSPSHNILLEPQDKCREFLPVMSQDPLALAKRRLLTVRLLIRRSRKHRRRHHHQRARFNWPPHRSSKQKVRERNSDRCGRCQHRPKCSGWLWRHCRSNQHRRIYYH